MKTINVAAAVIKNTDGQILVVRRCGGKYFETDFKWEFPGGKIEPNESPEKTVEREILEELEISIEPQTEFLKFSYNYNEFKINFTAVSCSCSNQKITLKEHSDFKWIRPDEMSELDFSPADWNIVAKLQENDFLEKNQSKLIGEKLKIFHEIDSTNTQLIKYAETEKNENDGLIFLADNQTAGRGRLGRNWQSGNSGNLTFSLLMRPQIPIEELITLPLVAGLAVAKTIKSYGINAKLKWPNDILADDKKICGILCEAVTSSVQFEGIVIGIGINVTSTPSEMKERGISIFELTNTQINRFDVLAKFCKTFEALYQKWLKNGFKTIHPELMTFDAKAGREITVKQYKTLITGQSLGIRNDGALLLQHPNGEIDAITCGEILQWDF